MPRATIDGTTGLALKIDGAVARITLNRPETRNALSRALLGTLEHVLFDLAADHGARVVVLAAEGPIFSSGHDLNELAGIRQPAARDLFEACTRVMLQLRRLPQPVIARVQGPAVAAGCQLVAGCDLAVAAEGATFATPGVRIGLFCSTPMVPLVRAIPAKPAFEMLFTGEPISAERALALGLVNAVVPEEELDDAVARLAESFLSYSPQILRRGKSVFYEGLSLSEPLAYDRATPEMVLRAPDPHAQEGIAAFLEKRRPHWAD